MCKMSFLKLRSLKFGNLCALQGFSKDARKVCSQKIKHPVLLPVRNMVLSLCSRKDNTLPDSAEKLDLDAWKIVMKSSATEVEAAKDTSDDEMDSSSTSIRELVEMWRLAGRIIPEHLSDEECKVLQELRTKSAKKKYLKYLAIKEGHKKAKKEKREAKNTARAQALEMGKESKSSAPKNTFLLQFWQKKLDNLYNWRAANAMIFGQPLVFDMSYEKCMSRKELENTVSQLVESEGHNRRSLDPFHIHFCNLKKDGLYYKELLKYYDASWDRLLITVTEDMHVDIFPRDNLVYLTADSPHVMRTFDHNKIYIIGSIVDKSIQTGLSFANAKRLKLTTARFPLDEFLQWEIGAKNLTLDQVIRILLTLKDTGDWTEALKYVPQRKHGGYLTSTLVQNDMPAYHRNGKKQNWIRSSSVSKFVEDKEPQKIKPLTDFRTKKRGEKKWWEK